MAVPGQQPRFADYGADDFFNGAGLLLRDVSVKHMVCTLIRVAYRVSLTAVCTPDSVLQFLRKKEAEREFILRGTLLTYNKQEMNKIIDEWIEFMQEIDDDWGYRITKQSGIGFVEIGLEYIGCETGDSEKAALAGTIVWDGPKTGRPKILDSDDNVIAS